MCPTNPHRLLSPCESAVARRLRRLGSTHVDGESVERVEAAVRRALHDSTFWTDLGPSPFPQTDGDDAPHRQDLDGI